MINIPTFMNWTDGYGNSRRDIVLATFVHNGICRAVVAFNDFTVVSYDPRKSKADILNDNPYIELYG